MLFANDKEGVKTYIDDVANGQEYYCPLCEEKLICKFGKIRSHHFAHASHSECRDSWHYDMSEWHSLWQSFFPKENQEVVFNYNGDRHRADVSIGNIIIEFQHSRLSPEEFLERNAFYHSLGKKIIWVFDVSGKVNWQSDPRDDNYVDTLETNSSIFSDDEIFGTTDALFLCDDSDGWPNDNGEETTFILWQVSWFRESRRGRSIKFGSENDYDDVTFVNTMLGKTQIETDRGTIPFLWRKNNVSRWAIFENSGGFRVKIGKNPVDTYKKYGHLYGNWSAPKRMKFNSESKQVDGLDRNWRIISYK